MNPWYMNNAIVTCKTDPSIKHEGHAIGHFDTAGRPTMLQVKLAKEGDHPVLALHWADYEIAHI